MKDLCSVKYSINCLCLNKQRKVCYRPSENYENSLKAWNVQENPLLDNFLVNLGVLTHVVLQILLILKHFCWTETVSYSQLFLHEVYCILKILNEMFDSSKSYCKIFNLYVLSTSNQAMKRNFCDAWGLTLDFVS